MIDAKVRFAQDVLPLLVIFNLFFGEPKSTLRKIAPLQTIFDSNVPVSMVRFYGQIFISSVWSNFISYVKVFVFFNVCVRC